MSSAGRPKTSRPAAEEAPRRTRENTSGTQGIDYVTEKGISIQGRGFKSLASLEFSRESNFPFSQRSRLVLICQNLSQ